MKKSQKNRLIPTQISGEFFKQDHSDDNENGNTPRGMDLQYKADTNTLREIADIIFDLPPGSFDELKIRLEEALENKDTK